MEQKFSDVYRTSFLTLDRYLQQSNTAQFYFRPLLPPLNTVSGEFYSLSPAQGTDPSIRINEFSSNGTLVGYGYVYDSAINTPPNYWTLAGSNIYNNNPGNVGIGVLSPTYPLQVVRNDTGDTGLNVAALGAKTIRVTQLDPTINTPVPAEIYFEKRNTLFPGLSPPAGAVGVSSTTRGMFLFYNNQDRINILPSGLTTITGNVSVTGVITANGSIASSVTTTSRVQAVTSNIPPATFVSTLSLAVNVTSLPYSVYLLTVEGSIDVDDGAATTATCVVDTDNGTPQTSRELIISCSVTGGEQVSTGSSFSTTVPIDKGSGVLNANITLTNCVFATPSNVYITAVGLC
jgi:hypothetical protein